MTQTDSVLMLLRFKGDLGVTQQDAIREIACYRLAARISDLKALGHDIKALRATDSHGHHFARYILIEAPVQMAAFG